MKLREKKALWDELVELAREVEFNKYFSENYELD